VLHPAYKLDYFKALRWEPEWIQEAKDLARERFDEFYKPAEEVQLTEKVRALSFRISRI
jgi:hypothetical protein